MTKVLIATDKPFASQAIEGIKTQLHQAGFIVKLLEAYTEKITLLQAIADVDALIVRSDFIDKQVIEAAHNLKIIVRAGAGYDNIDLQAATQRNIVVMNTPGQNANAVAELGIGMMVFYARHFFSGKSGTELKGKKLGVHAYGNVGRYMAHIAQGFGMKIYAYDPYVNADIMAQASIISVETVEDLYKECDYISLNIPLDKSTIKSINYDLLSLMPYGATLVNTARKEIIDEESLLKQFKTRTDFGYISDVAPDIKDELLKNYADRCFFTPKKMGAQTEEANINAGLAAAKQIVKFITKGVRTFQVNP